MSRPFRVFSAVRVEGIDDPNAVATHVEFDDGTNAQFFTYSIDEAREFSHELAVAADEAEAKALNQPSLP